MQNYVTVLSSRLKNKGTDWLATEYNAGLETQVAECKHCSWIHSAEGPAGHQSPTTASTRLRMKVTGPSKVSYFWTEKQLNTDIQKDYKNHETFEVLKIFMKAYQKFYFNIEIIRGEVARTCTIFCKWSKHKRGLWKSTCMCKSSYARVDSSVCLCIYPHLCIHTGQIKSQ